MNVCEVQHRRRGVAKPIGAWETPCSLFERYGSFVEQARQFGEPDLPVAEARLIFTMFGCESVEDWSEITDQVVHIHGKVYEVVERTSPSIDHERLVAICGAAGLTCSMSTEFEGHAFVSNGLADRVRLRRAGRGHGRSSGHQQLPHGVSGLGAESGATVSMATPAAAALSAKDEVRR